MAIRRPGAGASRALPPRRKALAQHHLRDGGLCRPLIDFLHLEPGRRVLEIGPGGGVLTRELLAAGAWVAAVELDLAWGLALPRSRSLSAPGRRREAGRLQIAVADALDLAWERLPSGWRVTGNLPYNVGTAIVERFLRGAAVGVRAGFLLQREVVDRMVATPGSAAYGGLSVLVALRARASRLAVVRAGSFVPPPRVDSAFVGLETVAAPVAPEALPGIESVIKVAFGQRRKNLRNALGAAFRPEQVERALAEAAIDGRRRAETLELGEFVALAGALTDAR